jgi:release factor glutamine methyltransferase
MTDVYEPREDSLLLEKYVRRFASGNVLDMGTGSGIQARAAAEKATSVIAVDINPDAIDECRKEDCKRISFVRSDLFSAFEGQQIRFDTIIFNAPYLPNDENFKDVALDGGKNGYEIIGRFLADAKNFLAKDGLILLVFSSFTNKARVDALIRMNGFVFKELERIHVMFEDIYCYRINFKF